jgi:hypothetical protein
MQQSARANSCYQLLPPVLSLALDIYSHRRAACPLARHIILSYLVWMVLVHEVGASTIMDSKGKATGRALHIVFSILLPH